MVKKKKCCFETGCSTRLPANPLGSHLTAVRVDSDTSVDLGTSKELIIIFGHIKNSDD